MGCYRRQRNETEQTRTWSRLSHTSQQLQQCNRIQRIQYTTSWIEVKKKAQQHHTDTMLCSHDRSPR